MISYRHFSVLSRSVEKDDFIMIDHNNSERSYILVAFRHISLSFSRVQLDIDIALPVFQGKEGKVDSSSMSIQGIYIIPNSDERFILLFNNVNFVECTTSTNEEVEYLNTYYPFQNDNLKDYFDNIPVNTIEFSNFKQDLFLVSWKDGSISLFHTGVQYPLLNTHISAHCGESYFSRLFIYELILVIKWSPQYPSIIYVMLPGIMFIIDLIQGIKESKHIEVKKMPKRNKENEITSFILLSEKTIDKRYKSVVFFDTICNSMNAVLLKVESCISAHDEHINRQISQLEKMISNQIKQHFYP